MEDIANNHLESLRKLFVNYKVLAEKAFGQLEETQLNTVPNIDSNSIAIIMQHMAGNMLSRFTDFLTSDGEKPWRNRDAEFEPAALNKNELVAHWNRGWTMFLDTLNALNADDLLKIVYIRNEGHTVLEALNRQLAHYSYHVGQIVFLAKMLKGQGFQSLSIPKGQSADFNNKMFGK